LDKVQVLFDETATCDFVTTHAKNVADYQNSDGTYQYGIRINFHEFLAQDFICLGRLGAHMKRRHGNGTKRHIKFDDEKMRLYTDIKIPTEDEWMRVTPELAQEMLSEEDTRTDREVKRKLARQPAKKSGTPSSGPESQPITIT
jgi:hypothetical protein